MTPDYRAMCAELLEWAERTSSHYYKQADVIIRARALLDQQEHQPEPEVEATPNDNDAWFHELVSEIARVQHVASGEGQAPRLDLAEAVVRWCRPTPQPPADGEVAASLIELRSTVMSLGRMRMFVAVQRIERAAELLQRQHPQPVPVCERLPGAKDCDAEGQCWAWRLYRPQDDDDGDFWMQIPAEWLSHFSSWSHWLPAHAIPTPTPHD